MSVLDEQQFKIIDMTEPAYCEYQIKVSSKFLCAKLKTLPKASDKLNEEPLDEA